MLQLTFNPGLTLTGFRTTRPRVLGCLDRLEIHCRDIPVILEQVRWGAGSTCSRFCGRVIIFLNHHIAIKPISPETAAKHCFAPGNEEKEIPGRPGFDIISRWNIGRVAWIGIPVRSVESADCRPGTKCRPGAKCILLQTADCWLDTKRRLRIDFFHQIRAILWLTLDCCFCLRQGNNSKTARSIYPPGSTLNYC